MLLKWVKKHGRNLQFGQFIDIQISAHSSSDDALSGAEGSQDLIASFLTEMKLLGRQ